jgi:hypothetical protein
VTGTVAGGVAMEGFAHGLDTRAVLSGPGRTVSLLGALLLNALVLLPQAASALPVFARQTGQNCVACHAGGQFPELTPYGRMFKMTGYTIGKRTLPFSVMGEATFADLASTKDAANGTPNETYAKNGSVLPFSSGSLFIGGKITDTTGAFVQLTYDNFARETGNGDWHGHGGADNMDFRYADHFFFTSQDLIFGVSLNNNPSVSDPWNTAPAWMQYVPPGSPGAYSFVDANAPYPVTATDGVAGLTAYFLWNQSIYGEVGFYRTADNLLSFMTAGTAEADKTRLQGDNNPYWRLAYTHEWGASNIMVGTMGMIAHVYDGSTSTSDDNAYQRIQSIGFDSQYQYLLDPHTVTAQLAYTKLTVNDSVNGGGGNGIAKPDVLRGMVSYVYRAKYGGRLSYFDQNDTQDSTQNTRGLTYEIFWTPVQYVRIGAQYIAYNEFEGASHNYDGFGRSASDNNTLFLYVWGAY